jgi:ATP-dependent protease ClpP protease subunit
MRRTTAKNEAGQDTEVGEIVIYGVLAEDRWSSDEISSKMFRDQLKALGDVSDIHIRINSVGGDVSTGYAVYSLLKQHPACKTVFIDGYALSAASIVAMAGDTVKMPGNALMMIHHAWTWTSGNAGDLRKTAGVLEKLTEAMLAVYKDKTGLPREELIEMLDAETWMTADEAMEKGFADETIAPLMAAARAGGGIVNAGGGKFDLTAFRNTPPGLFSELSELSELNETEGKDLTDKDKQTPATPNAAAAPAAEPQPGPAAANTEEAVSGAIIAERARMKALDELLAPGAEALIARAKYETGASPESVALEIIRAQKEAGTLALEARKADAADSGVNGLGAAKTGDGLGAGEAGSVKAEAIREAISKRRGTN